jgi:hypothetical protein
MRPTTTTMTKSHHTVAPSDMMCWVPPTVSSIAKEHPCPTICGASGNIGTISAKCTRALLVFEPMLWHITLIYVRRRLHNTPNQRDHCYCGTFHRRTPPRSRCEHTVGHRITTTSRYMLGHDQLRNSRYTYLHARQTGARRRRHAGRCCQPRRQHRQRPTTPCYARIRHRHGKHWPRYTIPQHTHITQHTKTHS